MIKLYHGASKERLKGLVCEDLLPGYDEMLHFHPERDAVEEMFGEGAIECDARIDMDSLPTLPDLGTWGPQHLAQEFYNLGVLSKSDVDDVARVQEEHNITIARVKLMDLLRSGGIKAFKYANKYEPELGDGWSVAVIDLGILGEPYRRIHDATLSKGLTMSLPPTPPKIGEPERSPNVWVDQDKSLDMRMAIMEYQKQRDINSDKANQSRVQQGMGRSGEPSYSTGRHNFPRHGRGKMDTKI